MTSSNGSARVRDLMSPDVRTCFAHDTAEHCARLMWEAPCGAVAIVDEAGMPISIITDRDICMAAWTQGKRLAEIVVASAMSDRLFTVRGDDSVTVAEAIMRRRGVRRLLVVDHHRELVGMISIDDIARHVHVGPIGLSDPPFSAEVVAGTVAALAHVARGS